jgi:hypothetical protein
VILTRLLIIPLLLLTLASRGNHQVLGDSSVPNPTRIWIVGVSQAALWTGSFIALNQAWYADYPKQPFHFFNDLPEWQQMDKAGHVWTAYQISRLSGDIWTWTGISTKKAVWLGGISGVAYQSIIEILDGFSEKWGFSVWDMASNVVGAGTYVSQQLIWKQQKISIKFSYHGYDYPADLEPRASELFGSGGLERVLKDYNGQTYWLNVNLRSFFPESGIPRWLNVSLGYNARLMLGGRENIWTDENGQTVDRSDIERYRRFFLSADVDLTKIRTKSKFLRSVFSAVNVIKIPAPALEVNTLGKVKFHGIYF